MDLPAAWYIFYYHDVSEDERVPPEVRTSPGRFAEEIGFMAEHFEMVPFSDGLARLRGNSIPQPIASVCFDDGFQGVLDNALPILEKNAIPHIIFLNGAFLEGRAVSDAVLAQLVARRWTTDEIRKWFPDAKSPRYPGLALRSYMHPDRFPDLWARVKPELNTAGLFLDRQALTLFPETLTQFGNHTRDHYWLAGLSREAQKEQILTNHEQLLDLPGYQSFLALPFGTSNCFDSATLSVNDEVHGDVVIKAVGGVGHTQQDNRWILERIGLSNEKPRIDDHLRDRVTRRNLGYRWRKLGRKIRRKLDRLSP